MNQPLDVLIIGAGFAGICAGVKLLERGISNFRIVEKSDGIGGTWHENTYPGAACDVPSHFYSFSFELNPNWSRVYSPRAEIQAYIEHCVDKYGLRPYITNGKHVVLNRLDETKKLWETRFADGDIIRSRHVISGIGGLHMPKTPEFVEQDRFNGVTMHSAKWNHSYDFSGKKVAVIGTAASAVQIIPELAEIVDQLYVFQRTPNYIVPRNDRPYTEQEKRRFRRFPVLMKLLRQFIFLRMELLIFPITSENSSIGRYTAKNAVNWMRNVVKDERLHDALTPDYQIGCKRVLVSDDYYAAFNRPNVHLITTSIDRFSLTAIQTTDNTHREVDAIIYATGFDLDKHIVSIDIIGQNNAQICDVWDDIPLAYHGVCTAGFPNYWFVTGPNTGVGTTSIIFMIEQAVSYILDCIELARRDTLISVKQQAMLDYNAKIQHALNDTVWASGCKSWYLREDGRNATLYPYSARTWRKQMKKVRTEDFMLA